MTPVHRTSVLSPSSVVVVGGSDRFGSVGKVVVDNILSGGFPGEVFVVNPRPQAIAGARWLADLDELPPGVDLAIVVTPAARVPEVIAKLGARDVSAAMVISSGVTSASGLREPMLAAARAHGLRIIGPNGLGLIAPHARLNASFARGAPRPGRLGFISQSGALVGGVIDWANSQGLGFSAIISAGDMADVDFGDMIDLLAADPHTDAILLYVEGVSDAPKLLSAAHAATRFKPVIVLKAGKTAPSRRATASHTGALAGDDAVHRCAFERAGMVVVDDLASLLDAAEILRVARRPHGPRLAIITNGGGAGVLAVDAMAGRSVELAELSATVMDRLNAALPEVWSKGDPVDLGGDATGERYAAAIAAVLDDDAVDALLVANCPTALSDPGALARSVAEAVKAARGHGRFKPVIGCWLGDDNRRQAEPALAAAEIPVFDTPDAAVRGFDQLLRARSSRHGLAATPRPPGEPARRDAARAIIDAARLEGRTLLSEVEAKAILKLYGVPAIDTSRAKDPDAVAEACAALVPPYVVKVISPQIPHKSDVGGVALDLPDAAAAAEAARAMAQRIARDLPQARIDGFAVQSMAPPGGQELLVGMTLDPIFGPIVAVGAGGTAVEVIADHALGLPPIDRRLAKGMIARTRISRLLAGYRDTPPADLDAIAAALEAVSALAVDLPDLAALDINPLRAGSLGVVALDARMVISAEPAAARLAILPPPREAWGALTTRFGQKLHVRPAGPDDEALLAAFFVRLSPEDLRLRFLSPVRTVDHERLSLMCDLDYRRVMTFLAFDDDQTELLATAMLAGGPDPECAEVAVTVRSDLKGRGLGWALLDHVLDYARARGVKRIESVESADNSAALGLEREMGFATRLSPGDTGLRIAERDLSPSG